MLADNTTCQQLVFKGCQSAGKLVAGTSSTLGWWNLGNNSGRFSDKVIKIPSRRGQMLCVIF
jgi:hypothetical protein